MCGFREKRKERPTKGERTKIGWNQKSITITIHSGYRTHVCSWARRGSNTGPLDLQSNALPTAPQTLLWLTINVPTCRVPGTGIFLEAIFVPYYCAVVVKNTTTRTDQFSWNENTTTRTDQFSWNEKKGNWPIALILRVDLDLFACFFSEVI